MKNTSPNSVALTIRNPSVETIDGIDHINNPHPRCPVGLLLDTSLSMQGEPISELQRCLKMFVGEVAKDALASLRVDPTVFTFGGNVDQIMPFEATMVGMTPVPDLRAAGGTPLGQATFAVINAIQDRRQLYRENALSSYAPWIVIMSDGAPTDEWENAAAQLKDLAERKRWNVLCVGVGEHANLSVLQRFCKLEPKRISTVDFPSFFKWLSSSLRTESRKPTTQTTSMELPPMLGSISA